MKLTLSQLKRWGPCDGYVDRFKELYGKSVDMSFVEKQLIKDEDWHGLNFLIEKRLSKLNKRRVCMFAYLVSSRALQYAYKKDLPVLKKATGFAKQYADTGKVDVEAAKSAAWSAESAAESVKSAVKSAESAKSAAKSAAWSAKSAAWSAAWLAAWLEAWLAVWLAVWLAEESAAESAVKSAAKSAAWSAKSAWSANYKKEYLYQLSQLTKLENV